MSITESTLPGVLVVQSRVFRDDRGCFFELWNAERQKAAGLPGRFVQDNVSHSSRGVLRGLHYQHPTGQGKFITVLRGAIFDVAVDIRRNSPTFGRWVGEDLSADNGRQLYIPEGFAHGFLVTGDEALVLYKCTATYDAKAEGSIAWDDPDLAISWPTAPALLSGKDRAAPRLAEIPPDRLPEI